MVCPDDMSLNTDSGEPTATANWDEPVGTDNAPDAETVRTGPAPGSAFDIGTNTVTYTVTDAAGNTDTCEFDITVTGKDCF